MKKLIINILLLYLFTLSSAVYAQQKYANISFDNISHDFGKITEEDGPVIHEFIFTNTGNEPLIIISVTPSPGCTSPHWSMEPVVPGEKGFIKTEFNPHGRSGRFNESVTIFSNSEQPVTVLRILGDVISREKTVADIYPHQIGGLRLKSNHLSFYNVEKSQQKSLLLEMINTSEEPITVSFSNVPSHIKIEGTSEPLKPNEKGVITVTYDASKKDDWGFVIDRVNVLFNGHNERNNRLKISATIKEDISQMTKEELEKAAKIAFRDEIFDFGIMKQNESVEHDFVFTNMGKSDLIIRKIKTSCGCTAVSPQDKIIPPGETSSIKAIFQAGLRKGKQYKNITVITNDPVNSKIILKITGTVE